MAIARPSALVGALSGALGGITASNQRAGLVLAHRPIKTRSTRGTWLRNQNRGAAAAALWRTMTPAQRQAWYVRAAQVPFTNRLGVTRTYTGFQLFLHYTRAFNFQPNLASLTPPPNGRVPSSDILSYEWTSTTNLRLTLRQAPLPIAVRDKRFFWIYPSMSKPPALRHGQLFAAGSISSTTQNISFATAWAVFGTPVAGQWVSVRLQNVQTSYLPGAYQTVALPYAPP